MLGREISTFVGNPDSADFNRLALGAFRQQIEATDSLRQITGRPGKAPESLTDWREIPLFPVQIRNRLLAPRAQTERLRSAVLQAAFTTAILRDMKQPPFLLLLADSATDRISSLESELKDLVTNVAGPNSLAADASEGIHTSQLRSWLGSRQREDLPVIIVTAGRALEKMLDLLARLELRFRLPPGSTLIDFGPQNRYTDANQCAEIIERISLRVTIPPQGCRWVYRAAGLTTPFFCELESGSAVRSFSTPHWTRLRILQPESLEEVALGVPGLIAVLDLTNLDSAIHVLTEDLGVAEAESFRLLGHASPEQLTASTRLAREIAGP